MHVLFVVAKYAKGGIYSRQHHFKLSLNQCSLYCQICKARRLFACDLWPCHCKFSTRPPWRGAQSCRRQPSSWNFVNTLYKNSPVSSRQERGAGKQATRQLQQAVSLSHHDLSTSVRIASHASTVVRAIETIIGFCRVKKGCRKPAHKVN